jgi:hypothetical protein
VAGGQAGGTGDLKSPFSCTELDITSSISLNLHFSPTEGRRRREGGPEAAVKGAGGRREARPIPEREKGTAAQEAYSPWLFISYL